MGIEVHERFRRDEYRFCLVGNDKRPIEKGWQLPENSHHFDSPRLQQHLELGGNFGVVCGKDFANNTLVVLDFDSEKIQNEVVPQLPRTLTVKSGGRGLLHIYLYFSPDDSAESFKILDPAKNTLIDVQCAGKQVICPSSKGSAAFYTVTDASEIATINRAELMAILAPYMTNEEIETAQGRMSLSPTPAGWVKVKVTDLTAELIKARISVSSVLSEFGIPVKGAIGNTRCPLHDSKGGRCLNWNDTTHSWKCYHCGKWGDIFNLWENQYGVDYETAKQVLGVRAGVLLPEAQKAQAEAQVTAEELLHQQELDADAAGVRPYGVWLTEGIPEIRWFIKDLIPSFGLTLFSGEGGSFKSAAAQELCYCLSNGQDWLGFQNAAGRPIVTCYVDEEMGEATNLMRMDALIRGHGTALETANRIYACIYKSVVINTNRAEFLKVLVDKYGIELFVVDSLSRCAVGDENSVQDMKMIQQKLKEHLWGAYPNVAVVMIHHTARDKERKGIAQVRGSGDIINQTEGILLFGNAYNPRGFTMSMVRSRNSNYDAVPKIRARVDFTENDAKELVISMCRTDEADQSKAGRHLEHVQQTMDWLTSLAELDPRPDYVSILECTNATGLTERRVRSAYAALMQFGVLEEAPSKLGHKICWSAILN